MCTTLGRFVIARSNYHDIIIHELVLSCGLPIGRDGLGSCGAGSGSPAISSSQMCKFSTRVALIKVLLSNTDTSPSPTSRSLSSRLAKGSKQEMYAISSQVESLPDMPFHSHKTCSTCLPWTDAGQYPIILTSRAMEWLFRDRIGKGCDLISIGLPLHGFKRLMWNTQNMEQSLGNWRWYAT